MHYGVPFERNDQDGLPPGFYYAHIPNLGLTTHGLDADGARSAAVELADVWLDGARYRNL